MDDFKPYTIPAQSKNERPFKAIARYGRWLVVTDGLKYIVHDGPDDLITRNDFRYGFNTRQQASDRAFSAWEQDKAKHAARDRMIARSRALNDAARAARAADRDGVING